MSVCLDEILKNSLFDGSTILAGRQGTDRIVQRVSVFDCPYHADILAGGIVEAGDLFISCLEQFQDGDDALWQFMESLIHYNSAGLLVVPTGRVAVLNQRIMDFCDEKHFPVILIKNSIPYAKIMSVINKYTAIDMINALNLLKIDKILFSNISDGEKRKVLHSINPRFKENIRALYVTGTFRSQLASMELWNKYAERENDTLIMGNHLIFLLSSSNLKELKLHSNVVSSEMTRYFSDFYLGFSRIHPLREIGQVLMEGERAVKIASALKVTQQEYEPMSSLQMLLASQGSQEEWDFYNHYVKTIANEVSSDALTEFLQTVEAFVANSGNYKKTAQQIRQHENTVRYRVNRVKQALGMEEDTIRFYETISLAVKLRIVLGEQFPGHSGPET